MGQSSTCALVLVACLLALVTLNNSFSSMVTLPQAQQALPSAPGRRFAGGARSTQAVASAGGGGAAAAAPGMHGCLITRWSAIWLVGANRERSHVAFPTTGCDGRATEAAELEGFPKAHGGEGAYTLTEVESAAACQQTGCDLSKLAAAKPAGAAAAAAATPAAAATTAVAQARPSAAAAAAAAAADPDPTAAMLSAAMASKVDDGCNRDHTKVLSRDDVLCRVPRGALAFVAMSNGAYGELGINWALLLLPLLARSGHGDRAFLVALDEEGIDKFVGRGLPTVRFNTKAKHDPRRGGGDGFRWEPGAFRDYGVTKAEVILWLLRAGRDVCISDVDTAWVATPYALLASVPKADVLAGTDCLHVPFDADRSHRTTSVKNCGHQPGSRTSAWFNTGVLIFRANERAIDLTAEWRERMAAVKGDAQIDDQLTFNQMVGTVWSSPFKGSGERHRSFYPIKAASDDGLVVYDGNGTRRVYAMPANQICSAHVYHVQQSATARGCLVLHLTFVEGWPKNPAKYWRLREAGLLETDPEPIDGRYLTFAAPVHAGPIPTEYAGYSYGRNGDMPGKTKDGRGWPVSVALQYSPRLRAHLDLVDRHIAALRNAIGMAKALGRQLVMPKMLCLCERSEGPAALLPNCVLDGSSTPIPHVCPLESILDVARLDRIWAYVRLRPWNFLNATIHTPRGGKAAVDPAKDVVTVRWKGDAAQAAAAGTAGAGGAQQPLPPIAGLDRPGAAEREVAMERGMSATELRTALAAHQGARVIHLESAEQAFGGFEEPSEAENFHRQIMTHMLGGFSGTWCCTSWDKPRGTITFKRPNKLPSGPQARASNAAARGRDIPERRPCYWQDCDANGHQK